jgi:hypothetical protein
VSATKKSPAKAKSPQKKSPTKTTSASIPASKTLYKYEKDAATFQKIVQVIDDNITQLRKAGVLFARPGYEQVGSLMTTRPAVLCATCWLAGSKQWLGIQAAFVAKM